LHTKWCFTIHIRPDFDEGVFEVVDSPAFTKRQDDIEKLKHVIIAEPGLSQNEIISKAGLMKMF
jgi:hypothetical protein